MTSLSAVHRPLTETFPRVRRREEAAAYALTEDQVAAFKRDGYVAGLDVLTSGEVNEFRRRLLAMQERLEELEPRLYEVEKAYLERPDEVVCHFLGAWMIDELFHDLLWHPAVTVPLAQLLGAERLRFWHDQVFSKPPRHPGVVPWHQDYAYWTRTTPVQHITMNIVLDDTTEDGGCLHFVPGSQHWDLLPPLPFDASLAALDEHLTAEQRMRFHPVAVPLRAGQASIHHSHTVHGSPANRSDRPRRAIVLNFVGPGVRSADGSAPLLRGTNVIPRGEVLGGEFFPIVFDREVLA